MGLIGRKKGFVDRGDPSQFDFDINTLIKDSTWRELDLSGIIPKGVKSVLIRMVISSSHAQRYIRLRKKGNTNSTNVAYLTAMVANIANAEDCIVSISSDRKIEYYLAGTEITGAWIIIRGWWF